MPSIIHKTRDAKHGGAGGLTASTGAKGSVITEASRSRNNAPLVDQAEVTIGGAKGIFGTQPRGREKEGKASRGTDLTLAAVDGKDPFPFCCACGELSLQGISLARAQAVSSPSFSEACALKQF